ncbi:hypothetical protein BGZ58_004976 [Dissophora ornata]|nr:hypothetical protein BGZ58_004976 [Dissophora ornata]
MTTTTDSSQPTKAEEPMSEGDAELEATFRELRLSSTEEALASAASALDREHRGGESGGTAAPRSSNSNSSMDSWSTSVSAEDWGSPKRTKRVLSQLDVSELIQMKISQLESATTTEDDEEKAIAKAMKKIHKEISQVVNGQEDHLGKVNFMQRKYLEMFQDMRKQERDHMKLKKKCELLQREKEILHREKDRLQKSNDGLIAERSQYTEERQTENLCCQINRENRRIKEEVQQKTDQISGSFEKAIVEFKDKVENDIAERQRLMDENDSLLRDKFQGFLEQYDVREKHFNSVVKSKDLELQLAQAKLEQQRQIAQNETNKVELLKSQLNAFTKTEAELRKQLNVYVEKFKQVEETLNKSNSLFQTFRREMEAMSKKGVSLEKVNQTIRAKCDTMNRNILEMVEERTKHQQALDAANKKRVKLETLCRALHAERAVLRKNLDIYEARYPGLSLPAHAIAAASTIPSLSTIATTTPSTPAATQAALSTMGTTATASVITGMSLSAQNGGIKQGKVGGQRTSITSGKLRQKQKQQHLQMLLQRCEQSSSLVSAVKQTELQITEEGDKGRSGLDEVIDDEDETRSEEFGLDDPAEECTCHLGMLQEVIEHETAQSLASHKEKD